MGSQQLLMILVGVIIVGIAIIVGAIPAFVNGMEQSNKDAVTQDCLKLAAAAQGYYFKDRMLGGGNRSFNGITIKHVGMAADLDGRGQNDNGYYSVTGNGSNCTIVGLSKFNDGKSQAGDDLTVTVLVEPSKLGLPTYTGW